MCNFLLIFSKNWPYYYNPFFDNRYFSSWPIPRKNERNIEKKWLGAKIDQKIEFWKNLTSVTSDFFVFSDVHVGAELFAPYECTIKTTKKWLRGWKNNIARKRLFPNRHKTAFLLCSEERLSPLKREKSPQCSNSWLYAFATSRTGYKRGQKQHFYLISWRGCYSGDKPPRQPSFCKNLTSQAKKHRRWYF